ncbi:MAG TPA: TetR/AcrR family transcriptional regulator C-terminal domain-containing protein [Actinocrinis sp.]|nr:TetR/AcrR family transcriptional regulator C-terminal domain-containing protein [Actinocrinis sp.]
MALDKRQVVTEAVALLDDSGLDEVTLRKLAQRLGVQAPTLYWHIPSKAALVTAIAEEILDRQFPDAALTPPPPDTRWQDWLIGIAEHLRRALLDHPDGARIVSASHLSLKMAAITELAISTLAARGLSLRRARLMVLTVEHFTVGHVLAEQAPRPDEAAVTEFDLDAFGETHPGIIAGITEYFQDGRTPDDLFRECLEVIVEGTAAAVSQL